MSESAAEYHSSAETVFRQFASGTNLEQTMKCKWIKQAGPPFSSLMAVILFTGTPARAQEDSWASKAPVYDFSAERGPHHRRVETTVRVSDEDGTLIERPTRYIEIASGMNYFEDGQWKQSEERIEPHPQGAAALKGYYKIIFGRNLNRAGAIHLILPDGKNQKNHPLGLYYYDRADGQWVKLSGMRDTDGVIIPPNRILYENAFHSIRGDVLYTYEKGRFEADVILRERPPAPGSFGLKHETTVLEMVTEFAETPEPRKLERVLKKEENESKRATMAQPDIKDEMLDFGSSQFVPGTAFALEADGGRPRDMSKHVPVGKRWLKHASRHILAEQVDYAALEPLFRPLPARAIEGQSAKRGIRVWPPTPAFESSSGLMSYGTLKASAGVVLDPVSVSGSLYSYTFSSGTTYLVTGNMTITGPATIQGGAVIKYESDTSIRFQYTVATPPSGTAYFTAVDDHTVGEQIGTDTVSGTYADTALDFYVPYNGLNIKNLEVRHADTAVSLYGSSTNGFSYTLEYFEMIYCNTGFSASGATPSVNYPCFNGVGTHYSGTINHSGDWTCSNYAPTLGNITDQETTEDSMIGFTVVCDDVETPGALIRSITWSDPTLISSAQFAGSGVTSTLNIYPEPNQSGTTTGTVSVSDGSATAQDSFILTVHAVNDAPVISSIGPRYTALNTASPVIGFSVSDVDSPVNSITISATSDNTALIPVNNYSFGGSGGDRTIQITPASDISGTATITVRATDSGGAFGTKAFLLTVSPDHSNPDGFQYHIGPMVPGSQDAGSPNINDGSTGGSTGGDTGGTTAGSTGGNTTGGGTGGTTAGTTGANTTGGGTGGSSGGGSGGGSYSGPAGPVDLNAIRNLRFDPHDTCNDEEPPFKAPPEAQFGTVDQTCPVNVTYQVKFTLSANLPDGTSPQFPFWAGVAGLGAGGATMYLTSPATGTRESCGMAVQEDTRVLEVPHGANVTLSYTAPNGNPGGILGGFVRITDVEIIGVSVDGGPFECPTCVGEFGGDVAEVGSADMRFNMGNSAYGRRRNTLQIFEQSATPRLTSAEGIYLLAGSGGDIDVVTLATNSQTIRQVKGPLGLVDVVTTNDYNYCINFYSSSNIANGGLKTNGLYQLASNAIPMRCYQFVNPYGSTNNPNCVRIIEDRGGTMFTNQFDFYPTNGIWQYWRANKARLERRQYSTNSGVITATHTIHDPVSTNTVRKRLQKLQSFNWGSSMTEYTRDPEGAQLKTTYSYYTSTNDNGYGRLKQAVYENGGWQILEYDSEKRISRVYSSYLNQILTTNANLCRKMEYDYTPISGSGDNGAYRPNLPRREVEYVLGQEVSRKYYVYKRGEKQEIVCTAPGAAWDATSNLKTITKRVDSGVFKDELLSIKRPDGTLTLYQYATNADPVWKMITVLSGRPDGGGTNVVEGTKTVTTVGLAGEMMTNQVFDIASGILVDQQVYSNYDAQLRPQIITFLDGTTQVTSYGCCGVESVTDRNGVTTTYGYDALRRKEFESVNGIMTIYGYDGASRVISVTRQGTNGTQTLLNGYRYDMAGRLEAETNAVGVITTYAESYDPVTGQTTRTTTYASGTADAATRIEIYARDGSVLKLTGTAVNSVRFEYGVESEGGVQRLYRREIKLNASGDDTLETTKTYTDFVGRKYKTVFAAASGSPSAQSYFNNLGQLEKTVDPDGVITLFGYNLEGHLQDSVLDTNRNSSADYNGLDRVSRTLSDAQYNSTLLANVRRTRSVIFRIITMEQRPRKLLGSKHPLMA